MKNQLTDCVETNILCMFTSSRPVGPIRTDLSHRDRPKWSRNT